MPTSRRISVPLLAVLFVAMTALLFAVVYLLGGTPLGRERGVAYADAPVVGEIGRAHV